MTSDPLAPYRWLQAPEGSPANPLDAIYCVSFLRGVDPAEVLRRFDPAGPPGREMSFDELREAVHEFVEETDGGDGGGYAGVVAAGEWSVAVELWGWFGTLGETAARLSQGCELVAVSRHDYASDGFVHAVNGEVVTAFDPGRPYDRHGKEPHGLDEPMREAGLGLEPPDELTAGASDVDDHGIARTFALAARITGVPMTRDLLEGPFLVGAVAEGRG